MFFICQERIVKLNQSQMILLWSLEKAFLQKRPADVTNIVCQPTGRKIRQSNKSIGYQRSGVIQFGNIFGIQGLMGGKESN